MGWMQGTPAVSGPRTARLSWLLVLFAAACAEDPEPPVTWHSEIAPIVERHCTSCHWPGGPGPQPLTTYADARRQRHHIEAEVKAGRMPPWLPDERDCAALDPSMAMSAAERALLLRWLGQAAPEGPRPASAAAHLIWDPRAFEIDYDLAVTMPEPYLPRPPASGFDDFRCFLLDWPEAETRYVNAVDVRPGNPRLLHHVLVFGVGPDHAAELAMQDGIDGRPGWDCYGAMDLSRQTLLGGWQPGTRPGSGPRHTGVELPAGSRILLHMHYNTVRVGTPQSQYKHPRLLQTLHAALPDDTGVAPDQSEIRFRWATGRAQGVVVPVLDPGWLLPGGMRIEAGDPHAVFEYRYRPGLFFFGLPVRVYGVGVHMHVLGRSARIVLHRDAGRDECLLDIPRWDFAWGGNYTLREPVTIGADDEVSIRCTFDNSAANYPFADGQRLPPQDLEWGGEFPDEMCAGLLGGVISF